MSGRDKIILQKIVKYAGEALSYTHGMDFDAFSQDSKTMSATAFVLGQIGELAKEISPEIETSYPKIPWKGMRGMRNRIVHDYENVDLAMLWDVIANDLPELLTQINSLVDPFYSEANISRLRKAIADVESGKAKVIEHELIEAEDD